MTDTPVDRLRRWEEGKTPGPWYVTLFPTDRCNLQCAICWQRVYDVNYSDEVPDGRLLEFVDECADLGAREWTIVGGGEPMVRADLVMRLCERIRERNMNGVIQTNGLVFKPEHFMRLLKIGWSRLVFSIDGPTREINDVIRSEGAFDRATTTVGRLRDLKREQGADLPCLSMHSVLTNANCDKLEELVELAHSLGCGSFALGDLITEGERARQFALREDQRSDLPARAVRAIRRAQQLGIEENLAAFLPDASGRAKMKTAAQGLAASQCFDPWLSIAVLADGKVGPCCVFWDEHAGNIRDARLKDIWEGRYLRSVREGILQGRFPSYCEQCTATLRSRSELLRRKMQWSRMGTLRQAAGLVKKAVSSTARFGLRRAIHRGVEWFRIMKR